MDHDHLPALSALLFSAPIAVLALAGLQLAAARGAAPARLALERVATTSSTDRLIALAVMAAGAVHAGLVFGHADEPVLAASFAAAAAALVGLAAAALLRLPLWRPLSATALIAVLAAYSATRLVGFEGLDVLGVATCGLELGALALVAASG